MNWMPISEAYSDKIPDQILVRDRQGVVAVARRDPQVKTDFTYAREFMGEIVEYALIEPPCERSEDVHTETGDRVDNAHITLSTEEFEAFQKALDEPAKVLPGLKKLMSQVSVFEPPGESSENCGQLPKEVLDVVRAAVQIYRENVISKEDWEELDIKIRDWFDEAVEALLASEWKGVVE